MLRYLRGTHNEEAQCVYHSSINSNWTIQSGILFEYREGNASSRSLELFLNSQHCPPFWIWLKMIYQSILTECIYSSLSYLYTSLCILQLIQSMQSLRKTALLAVRLTQSPVFLKSDNWKDRDEASEKVYISQTEKQTIKKLLKKVQEQEVERLNSNAEFEKKLREILQKYKVNNDVFFSEVSNLHKSLIG